MSADGRWDLIRRLEVNFLQSVINLTAELKRCSDLLDKSANFEQHKKVSNNYIEQEDSLPQSFFRFLSLIKQTSALTASVKMLK